MLSTLILKVPPDKIFNDDNVKVPVVIVSVPVVPDKEVPEYSIPIVGDRVIVIEWL